MSRYKENPQKYAEIMTNNRIKCKCGHSVDIPAKMGKVICNWCNNYVFKDKKTEFEYRMKERLNNGK